MNRSPVLLNIVKAMFTMLALAFLFVLFSSLSGPRVTTSPLAAFDDVMVGQTALRRYSGERVWVTRLSASQRQNAEQLLPFVVDPSAGCSPETGLCVVTAATDRSGIEIVYSDSPPAQLSAKIPWHGGFVDPTNGHVYDRLGRAYRSASIGVSGLSVVVLESD